MTLNDPAIGLIKAPLDLTKFGMAALVGIWRRIIGQLKEEEKNYEEICKPLKELLQKVKGEVATRMDKDGVNNIKTSYGLAYFYNVQKIKVVDRDIFFDWVIDTRSTGILTTNLSKDGLRELAQLPPGVEITETFRDIRLRDS